MAIRRFRPDAGSGHSGAINDHYVWLDDLNELTS